MKILTAFGPGDNSVDLNRRSIYKTLFVGMCVVIIPVLLAAGLILVQMSSLLREGRNVAAHSQPVQIHTYSVVSGLERTIALLEHGTTSGKADFSVQVADVWKKEAGPAADSIRLIVRTWQESEKKRLALQWLDKTDVLREKLNHVSTYAQTVQLSEATMAEATLVSSSALDSTLALDASAAGVVKDAVSISYNPQLAGFLNNEILPLQEEIKLGATALNKINQQEIGQFGLNVEGKISLLKKIGLLTLLGLLVSMAVLLRKIQRRISKSISAINTQIGQLAQGIIPSKLEHSYEELDSTVDSINLLATNLSSVSEFAQLVGQGNFDSDIKVFNDSGELGGALARMRDGLKQVAEQDKIRYWTNEGLAKFGDIMRENDQNLKILSDRLISNLVKYLHANQGGVFVVNNDDQQHPFLSLTACYAFERKKFIEKEIQPGQGLVGQVWQEGQSVYLREIPDSYVRITSGLGGARPRYLLIVPLKSNGEVHGVLELASFHDFQRYMIEFVEKIAETIASSIAGTRVAEQTNLLLQEAQQMTEQMRAQEEEMRQNMEELQATQEEMHRSQRETAEHLDTLTKEKEALLQRIEELQKEKK